MDSWLLVRKIMWRWVFSVYVELWISMCKVVSWTSGLIGNHTNSRWPRVSQCQHYWCFRPDFSLLHVTVLHVAGCLAASLTPTHQMPAVPLPLVSGHCKNGSGHSKASPGGRNHPWLKTIAPASHWSRKCLIEDQDMFPLHSHKLDLCWFHKILNQRSSICGVHSTGCHVSTKEIKSWN